MKFRIICINFIIYSKLDSSLRDLKPSNHLHCLLVSRTSKHEALRKLAFRFIKTRPILTSRQHIINGLFLTTSALKHPKYSPKQIRRSADVNTDLPGSSYTPQPSLIYRIAPRIHLFASGDNTPGGTIHVTDTITTTAEPSQTSPTLTVTQTVTVDSSSVVDVHVTKTITDIIRPSQDVQNGTTTIHITKTSTSTIWTTIDPLSSQNVGNGTTTIHITKTSTSTLWTTTTLASSQNQTPAQSSPYSIVSTSVGPASTGKGVMSTSTRGIGASSTSKLPTTTSNVLPTTPKSNTTSTSPSNSAPHIMGTGAGSTLVVTPFLPPPKA